MANQEIDFDNYAEKYDDLINSSTSFFEEDTSYFARYKVSIFKNLITNNPVNILEFGCGTGRNLSYLQKAFPKANISGCDISQKSLSIAEKNNPNIELFNSNNHNQSLKNNFDAIFIACVLHHIKPPLWQETLKEIYNYMKKDASLIIFEHNPLNPVTRKLVNDCPFDKDAVLLRRSKTLDLMEKANLKDINSQYCLFLPEKLSKYSAIEKYISWLPLGGQYWVQGRK